MKSKLKVRFNYIEIYLFSRCLGFDKVPERGNNPLGMENNHFNFERIDVKKKNYPDLISFPDGDSIRGSVKLCTSTPMSSKMDSYKNCSEDDNESTHSIKSIDYTAKSLQPLTPMQRKKCLEKAGVDMDIVDDVDRNPKILAKLRENRKQVGCKCSNSGKCDTIRCICSSESIPCQSDGNKFPCKCGDKCSNTSGKRVYVHEKIRFHYQHTFERDLYSNCELDIDLLSNFTGECPSCNKVSEDYWKTFSTAYHQTRSRKRTSESNGENMKFSKQISMESNSEPVATSNGNGYDINNPVAIDGYLSIKSDLNNHPIVMKKTSLDMDVNKENIHFLSDQSDIKMSLKKLSSNYTNRRSSDTFKSPSKIRISNSSLICPQQSMVGSNRGDDWHLSAYLAELNYHRSFSNQEFVERSILSPSVITPSPLRFNAINLAPDISLSINSQHYQQNLPMATPDRVSIRELSITIDPTESDNTGSNNSATSNLSKNDSAQSRSPVSQTADNCQPIIDNVDNGLMTSQLQSLHLTILNPSDSPPSPLCSPDKCQRNNGSKRKYLFRNSKPGISYVESPFAIQPKRKSLRMTKPIKGPKLPVEITKSFGEAFAIDQSSGNVFHKFICQPDQSDQPESPT